jgi:phytoene dehydrogenase-like protein
LQPRVSPLPCLNATLESAVRVLPRRRPYRIFDRIGSSAYPLGAASPFFRSLAIDIPWLKSAAACAHPLDDGTAVMLEHSVEDTLATLDAYDKDQYRSLIEPIVLHFSELSSDLLGPVRQIPRHPLMLAKFGFSAFSSASALARSHFKGKRARAFFAGMATHSILPLETATSAAVALTLMTAGHANGWPIARGGAQTPNRGRTTGKPEVNVNGR